MKYSSVPNSEKFHNNGNRDRFFNMGRLVRFLFTSLAVATLFSFFVLYSPYPFEFIPKQGLDSVQNQQDHHAVQEQQHLHDQNNVLSEPRDQHHHLDQNNIPPKPRISKFENNPIFYLYNSLCTFFCSLSLSLFWVLKDVPVFFWYLF